jgi:hypothetical protein
VTEQHRKEFSEEFVNRYPDEKAKQHQAALLRQMTFPARLPAFSGWGGLASTADGGVWIARWAPPSAATRTWYVVSPSGTVRATIDLPRELNVLDAGDDYVVVSGKNKNDEMVVMVYAMTR